MCDQYYLRHYWSPSHVHLSFEDRRTPCQLGDMLLLQLRQEVNTVFVQYGGMLYDKIQTDIRRANVERIRSENNWIHDDPKSAHLWMYA